MNKKQGFSLVEIIVVVAVLGILAAVALPMYQDYVIRARVLEAVEVADAARTTMILDEANGSKLDNRQLYLNLNAMDATNNALVSLEWVKGTAGGGLKGYMIAGLYLPSVNPVSPHAMIGFALEWHDNGEWRCVNAGKYHTRKMTAPDLDSKYLPPFCHDNAGALGKPGASGKAAQCAPGQDKVTVKLQGVDTDACFTACPTGQARDQANPQTCLPPAASTPAATAIPVAAPVNPPLTPPAAPTVSTPAAKPSAPPSPPKQSGVPERPTIQCHVCDPNAPPDLCELLSVETTCTYPNNFCVTSIDNHADGTKAVTRRCGNFENDAYREWYQGTSDDDKCRERIDVEQHLDFTCTFACDKDNCNQSGRSLRPEERSLYQPK